MTLPASRATTVFRACVVSAIREGETLMEHLVGATKVALAGQEESTRDVRQRNLVADALRLLTAHEAPLVKGYPLALLEAFADGPARARVHPGQETGIDFGELALMDEADVLAQVELSRAQQVALHVTDAALSELNALVSSAQGLPSVQPERNPLRPDNYIRALQQVVSDARVSGEVRQLWMAQMRELLGEQLVGVYQRAAQGLREHGVQPVGYAVAGMPGVARSSRGYSASVPPSGYMGVDSHGHSLHSGMGSHYGTHYGTHGMGLSGWAGASAGVPLAAHAEEALLTVNMLQQMLAGGGDPYAWQAGAGAGPSGLGPVAPAGYPTPHAVGAMEDLAQLERLVGRLAGGGHAAASGWHSGAMPVAAPAVAQPAPPDPEQIALGVVSRMMDNIARDTRLLPPVQRAVQSLAPALRQLVRYDTNFFADEQHPARRLLDELTQRSLAFEREDSPGFSRFMRLVDEVVGHLAAARIDGPAPFERVLRALEKAWETQERHRRERRAAKEREARERERRALLAERLAADFRRLEGAAQAPPDLLAFVIGPWAQVVASAQTSDEPADERDAGEYLGLVPLLLACGQEDAGGSDAAAMAQAIADALPCIERGLQAIGHPAQATAQTLARLRALQSAASEAAHQAAQEAQAARDEQAAREAAPSVEPQAMPAPASAPVAAGSSEPDSAPEAAEPVRSDAQEAGERRAGETFRISEGADPAPAPPPVPEERADSDSQAAANLPQPRTPTTTDALELGCWVEIASQHGAVRRQLTWVSPNRTLFLFNGADGSGQSMTRRMIDKLSGDGAFRLLDSAAGAPPSTRH